MILVDGVDDFIFGERAVVEHLVLIVEDVVDLLEQGLVAELHQFGGGEDVGLRVLRAVHRVGGHPLGIAALVELGVATLVEGVELEHLQGLGVGFRVGDDLLGQLHGLFHILGQAAYRHLGLFTGAADIHAAGQFVEGFLHFFRGHVVGAQEGEVVGGEGHHLVGVAAGIEVVGQLEGAVAHVLLVEHGDVVLRAEDRHVFLVVHENGFDGRDGRGLEVAQELAGSVAVHHDRRDGRFGDAGVGRIGLLKLVDLYVIVLEVLVGESHDVVLGDLGELVDLVDEVFPFDVVDEAVHFGAHQEAGAVALLHEAELGVVDDGGQQVFVEFAFLDLLDLGEGDLLDFFQALALERLTHHHEGGVVGHGLGHRVHAEDLLLLVNVEVDQAGLAVGQDGADQVDVFGFGAVGTRETPGEEEVGRFKAEDVLHHRGGDGIFRLECHLLEVRVGFELAEILVDDLDGFVGVEVAGEADGHVVGHVPFIVILLHVGDRRVLEVVAPADDGGVVRVFREQGGEGRFLDFLLVHHRVHVVLLVDGLQLGVEAAENDVLEAVGLDLGPVLQLVGRNVLGIAGHVVAGVGIGAATADGRHRLVVLVGDEDLGGFIRNGVDLVIDGFALFGIGGLAIDLEEFLDLVEERFFLRIVRRSELFRALEHQVFEIVGETGGLLRVVLAADLHGDVRVDARLVLVDDHINLQTVVQSVDTGVRRVALDGFVLVFAAAGRGKQGKYRHKNQGNTFHYINNFCGCRNYSRAKIINKRMISKCLDKNSGDSAPGRIFAAFTRF